MGNDYAYGLWPLVIVHSLIVIIFAFSFSHPVSKRDWRCFGSFSAFVIALFTEMYGFPLSIYMLSGWLSSRFPDVNLFSHEAGHIWYTLLGIQGNPHTHPLHIASNVLIVGGFALLIWSWRVLYRAQIGGRLATSGPYAVIRHPQYIAFIVIMLGFLLQWPALSTLIMFPVLVWFYVRLARREEREMLSGQVAAAAFSHEYEDYAANTPAFIPRLRFSRRATAGRARTGGAAAAAVAAGVDSAIPEKD